MDIKQILIPLASALLWIGLPTWFLYDGLHERSVKLVIAAAVLFEVFLLAFALLANPPLEANLAPVVGIALIASFSIALVVIRPQQIAAPTVSETRTPMLVKCVYCDHQVSQSATACPACKESNPKGEVCPFCQRRMRRDEQFRLPTGGCHIACLETHFTIPAGVICRECNAPLADRLSPATLAVRGGPACPSCGLPAVLGAYSSLEHCIDCGLPIYPALGQKAGYVDSTVTGYTESDSGYISDDITYYHGHGFCTHAVTKRREDAERSAQVAAQRSGCAFLIWTVSPLAGVTAWLFHRV